MMKKLLILVISLFIVVGCGCSKQMSAKDVVKDYLEQYRLEDEKVLEALDEYIATNEDLSDNQRNEYKEVLKKQYKNLKYKIVNETYDGDEAIITVNVTVFDLYKVQVDANNYLNNHQDEFLNEEGVYDKNKFLDYKLEQMKKYKETTDYTIEFHVVKNDNMWEVNKLSTDDLEKIHGIFQYES